MCGCGSKLFLNPLLPESCFTAAGCSNMTPPLYLSVLRRAEFNAEHSRPGQLLLLLSLSLCGIDASSRLTTGRRLFFSYLAGCVFSHFDRLAVIGQLASGDNDDNIFPS